jgi:hypothetical protein
VVALSAVGAWLCVSLRKPSLALLLTFVFVILIPWIIGYTMQGWSSILPAKTLVWIQSVPLFRTFVFGGVYGFSLGRTVVWLLKNLAFTLWALRHLYHHFREAAAETAGRPEWQRTWSWWNALQPWLWLRLARGFLSPGP